MIKRHKNETRYYERIRKWLTNRLGYYTGGKIYFGSGKERFFTKTGIKELQADIVGIKYSGNNLFSDINVCVVEVKDKDHIARQHINQAVGYKSFAHYVYLASPCPINENVRSILHSNGIGYLQILKNKIVMLETPSISTPSEKELLRLLQSLWIGKCTICQCYFPLWAVWCRGKRNQFGKSYFTFTRPKVPNIEGDLEYEWPNVHGDNMIFRSICYYCKKQLFENINLRKSIEMTQIKRKDYSIFKKRALIKVKSKKRR